MNSAFELLAPEAVNVRELELAVPEGESVPRVLLVEGSLPSPPDPSAGRLGEDALRALTRGMSERSGARYCSRSYCFPRALVASHDAAVGVDIERVQTCDQAFADSIRTPTERAAGVPAGDPDHHFTSLWCSKEALSKALGDPLAYDPRRLEGPGAWADGRCGPWRSRALDVGERYVAWVCWRTCALGG
jgi:4'-phosphopantetheinyl transferase superfamily